jgi:stage II sporulation protein AA (anti-sigma F factor antagonist)
MARDICVVRPEGRLDSANGSAFQKELLDLIEEGTGKLLLDLSELQYISSAGLRVVLIAAERMKSSGGRIALCSLNRHVNDVFEISGFSAILEIFPSYDDAAARLSAA